MFFIRVGVYSYIRHSLVLGPKIPAAATVPVRDDAQRAAVSEQEHRRAREKSAHLNKGLDFAGWSGAAMFDQTSLRVAAL